ncbi:hypothetical protein ACFQGT_19145 [Natrialbaceae archaeon GCM10025810]|uniref:hypothetical protein n=1 Tax=Halovalidus salilacus TaxID=3075124 RepID=UPI00360C0CF2
MTTDEEIRKGLAICDGCGSAGPAHFFPDGRVHLIGTGPTCSCGSSDLRPIE